jgi:hypothetical protein
MRDLVRLIVWMVADLFRSRAALEVEVWMLRQQINVLRRTAPKKHRVDFRLYWRCKSKARGGRPTVPLEVRTLIREVSIANPLRVRLGSMENSSSSASASDRPAWPRTWPSDEALSLSQTQSHWQLIENRATLLRDERSCQAHCSDGRGSVSVADSCVYRKLKLGRSGDEVLCLS